MLSWSITFNYRKLYLPAPIIKTCKVADYQAQNNFSFPMVRFIQVISLIWETNTILNCIDHYLANSNAAHMISTTSYAGRGTEEGHEGGPSLHSRRLFYQNWALRLPQGKPFCTINECLLFGNRLCLSISYLKVNGIIWSWRRILLPDQLDQKSLKYVVIKMPQTYIRGGGSGQMFCVAFNL